MAVLLIGSTGNGKSCFGNYLLDPSEDHIENRKTFATAKTNLPQTQYVQNAQMVFKTSGKEVKLTVIDTPGLNESAEHDLRHMIEVIDSLQRVDGVLACILVVKFNSKIDTQYRATVRYYSRLLPTLFQRNVVIVMTDYAMDSRSETIRRKQGIDVDQVKRNTIREIVQGGDLSHDPILFLIDSLPYDDEEKQFNFRVREAIIDYVTSLKPFPTSDLMVAKTDYLKSQDAAEICTLDGEVTGYNMRLQEANVKAKEVLKQYQSKEEKVTRKQQHIQALESNIEDKDSSDTVVVKTWSVSKEWKILKRHTECFHVETSWTIHGHTRWTNGKCEWKDFEVLPKGAKGKVQGDFMRGLYASLTLETAKRERYHNEIARLVANKHEAEKELKSLNERVKEMKDQYTNYKQEIELLCVFIAERRKKITQLSKNYMSLDEAKRRLDQLNSPTK